MRTPQDTVARSKSILVLVTPELQDSIKKLAVLDGITPNFKAYQILKQYVKENQHLVEYYNKMRNEIPYK